MSDYWFKQKRYGLGATPANWKGWAALLLMLGGTFATTMGLSAARSAPSGEFSGFGVTAWWVLEVVVLGGFLVLARAKTEGGWRWRWGGRSD